MKSYLKLVVSDQSAEEYDAPVSNEPQINAAERASSSSSEIVAKPDFEQLISESQALRQELRCVESGFSLFRTEIEQSLSRHLALDFSCERAVGQ
jgi:hypothetical protein